MLLFTKMYYLPSAPVLQKIGEKRKQNGDLYVSHLSTSIKKFAAENILLECKRKLGKEINQGLGEEQKELPTCIIPNNYR